MSETRIPYKPNLWVFSVFALMFGIFTLVLGDTALTNKQGLVINYIIEISTNSATVLYWGLCVLFALLALIGLCCTILSFTSENELLITDDSLSVPKNSFSSKIETINYNEIIDLKLQTVQKEESLIIVHSGGKLAISKSMLPSKQIFDEVVQSITKKVTPTQ